MVDFNVGRKYDKCPVKQGVERVAFFLTTQLYETFTASRSYLLISGIMVQKRCSRFKKVVFPCQKRVEIVSQPVKI